MALPAEQKYYKGKSHYMFTEKSGLFSMLLWWVDRVWLLNTHPDVLPLFQLKKTGRKYDKKAQIGSDKDRDITLLPPSWPPRGCYNQPVLCVLLQDEVSTDCISFRKKMCVPQAALWISVCCRGISAPLPGAPPHTLCSLTFQGCISHFFFLLLLTPFSSILTFLKSVFPKVPLLQFLGSVVPYSGALGANRSCLELPVSDTGQSWPLLTDTPSTCPPLPKP